MFFLLQISDLFSYVFWRREGMAMDTDGCLDGNHRGVSKYMAKGS